MSRPQSSLRLSQSYLNSLEIIVAQLSTLRTPIFRNAEQTPALALTALVRIEDRGRGWSAGFKMLWAACRNGRAVLLTWYLKTEIDPKPQQFTKLSKRNGLKLRWFRRASVMLRRFQT
jgi:hypothetical protein